MTNNSNEVEKLERIMEQLAESVLELSDEAIRAEITEFGVDPREEAERIRLLLREASEQETSRCRRLNERSDLG